jgi:hypothetical protein
MRSCKAVELMSGFESFETWTGAWLGEERKGIWKADAPAIVAHSARVDATPILIFWV